MINILVLLQIYLAPCFEVYDLSRSCLHSLHHSSTSPAHGHVATAHAQNVQLPSARAAKTSVLLYWVSLSIKEYVHELEICSVSETASALDIQQLRNHSAKLIFRMNFAIIFAVLASMVVINSQLVSSTGDPILLGKATYTNKLVCLHGKYCLYADRSYTW